MGVVVNDKRRTCNRDSGRKHTALYRAMAKRALPDAQDTAQEAVTAYTAELPDRRGYGTGAVFSPL